MGLGTAVLFEALTVLETQDKTVRAASPWQDDPYDAVVSLAQFTVPMLALLISLRLLAWRSPGGPDRAHQMMRAVAAMTGLIGLTAVFEWAAVAAHVLRWSWNGRTGPLIAGLAVCSLLVAVVLTLLMRCRRPRGLSAGWRHDWLGDVVLICERLPVLRHRATERAAAWVRGHAMSVFTVASMLAAGAVVGALAVGERWANPLLIGWAVVVETAAFIAFCLISNVIAGFIARPIGSRARRVTETAVVSGAVAVQVAVAFRDILWHLVRGGPLTSVPDLIGLTLGTGAATAIIVAAGLLFRPQRPGTSGRQRRAPAGRDSAINRHA